MCARYIKEVSRQQTCAKIPKRSEILDPQDPGSCRILDLAFSLSHGILKIWILSRQYCRGILGILDLRQERFCWILGSWIHLEQVVVGSWRSWILHNSKATVFWTSFTTNDILLPVPLIYALLKLLRYVALLRISTTVHTLTHPFCAELKTGSPCRFLHISYCGCVNRMW